MNEQAGEQNGSVSIVQFQSLIREMYYEKDAARGIAGTFMWLIEEVGELSTALREIDSMDESKSVNPESASLRVNLQEEFADVLAWLATLANVVDIDLNRAVQDKYGSGCPGCEQFVCVCPDSGKP
jgi:NTP pyrophosphatase (non-canonical NTP hydrolase)